MTFVQIFTGGMTFISYSTVIFETVGFTNQLVLGLIPALAAVGWLSLCSAKKFERTKIRDYENGRVVYGIINRMQ